MDNFLQINDYVGVSFWIVSVAMAASTVFFLYEFVSVTTVFFPPHHVDRSITLSEFSKIVFISPVLFSSAAYERKNTLRNTPLSTLDDSLPFRVTSSR